MARVRSGSGARDRVVGDPFIVSGARVSARGGAIIVASMVLICAGCAASPGVGTQASPTPRQSSPTATPSEAPQVGATESLSFADGAQLDPLAMVGWHMELLATDDAAWRSNPAGDVGFVNADSTCTAYYFAEIIETAAADDRSASDEYLVERAGATTDEIATYAEDGYFALTHASTPESANGEVASRNVGWDTDEQGILVAVRVFTNLDSTASQMANAYALQLECDAGINPWTQLHSLDEFAQIVVDP